LVLRGASISIASTRLNIGKLTQSRSYNDEYVYRQFVNHIIPLSSWCNVYDDAFHRLIGSLRKLLPE
jgi:hypothetical protein